MINGLLEYLHNTEKGWVGALVNWNTLSRGINDCHMDYECVT